MGLPGCNTSRTSFSIPRTSVTTAGPSNAIRLIPAIVACSASSATAASAAFSTTGRRVIVGASVTPHCFLTAAKLRCDARIDICR
jgi:hypothetical protein